MIPLLAAVCAIITFRWLPCDLDHRARVIAHQMVTPLDDRVIAWWGRRKERTPGQPMTTHLLQLVISELRAGTLTDRAFEHVVGCTTPEQLLSSPPTADLQVWRDVAHVWTAADDAGFSLAGALERIHRYALTDQEIAREVRSNAAAPRFGLASMAAMPIVAWMVGSGFGARPLVFLFTNPLGWVCLVTGVLLLVAAGLWMRALTRHALA